MSNNNRRGRPHVFPDPKDRSKNDPAVMVSSKQVIGIYNQETGEQAQYVTDNVKTWFCNEAKAKGWDSAEFIGNQCLLKMNL
ncbi:MAG: hypothetical protein IJU26_07895 [Synergistaceae bacterium]|nr:hypothetical protein [Synergistaceae bacterium]